MVASTRWQLIHNYRAWSRQSPALWASQTVFVLSDSNCILSRLRSIYLFVCSRDVFIIYLFSSRFQLKTQKQIKFIQWQTKLHPKSPITLLHRPLRHDVLPRRIRYNGSGRTSRNFRLGLHDFILGTIIPLWIIMVVRPIAFLWWCQGESKFTY